MDLAPRVTSCTKGAEFAFAGPVEDRFRDHGSRQLWVHKKRTLKTRSLGTELLMAILALFAKTFRFGEGRAAEFRMPATAFFG